MRGAVERLKHAVGFTCRWTRIGLKRLAAAARSSVVARRVGKTAVVNVGVVSRRAEPGASTEKGVRRDTRDCTRSGSRGGIAPVLEVEEEYSQSLSSQTRRHGLRSRCSWYRRCVFFRKRRPRLTRLDRVELLDFSCNPLARAAVGARCPLLIKGRRPFSNEAPVRQLDLDLVDCRGVRTGRKREVVGRRGRRRGARERQRKADDEGTLHEQELSIVYKLGVGELWHKQSERSCAGRSTRKRVF